MVNPLGYNPLGRLASGLEPRLPTETYFPTQKNPPCFKLLSTKMPAENAVPQLRAELPGAPEVHQPPVPGVVRLSETVGSQNIVNLTP